MGRKRNKEQGEENRGGGEPNGIAGLFKLLTPCLGFPLLGAMSGQKESLKTAKLSEQSLKHVTQYRSAPPSGQKALYHRHFLCSN